MILDNKQRYLLADEVGLGKTIEAGIIIHDLLARNPKAKILILCPGTLVQQWLTEMYSKFCGVIFCLPEISGMDSVISERSPQNILSFHMALKYRKELAGQRWDLVVLDEVHHLLRVKSLYGLAKELSLQDSGLLLLSALPAQHRDQEYYDLLSLLEPKRYRQDDPRAREHFSKLFDRQREIGGRIGVVNRRLSELEKSESIQKARVIRQLEELMELPVLKDDQFLKASLDDLDAESPRFSDEVHKILHHISDFYRINRRILRNRREKLIQSEQLDRIRRDRNVSFYNPDQYELDAFESLERLLQSMLADELREGILLPLARQLYQAKSHPATLLRTLKIGEQAQALNPQVEEYNQLFDFVSYADWDGQMMHLWGSARTVLDTELFEEAIHCSEAWKRQGEQENTRLKTLMGLLEKKHRALPNDKFILFAGFPKLGQILAEQFTNRFGEKEIARFYFGLHNDPAHERNLKEKEVRRFRVDPQTWLLVCDETGGEGRNFQFAAELFHYDLPWQVAKIEQRIGRLDRLSRKRKDVVSNVVVAKGSKEEAWLDCLSEGFGIFNQSISGLEFSLRDIELEVTRNLLKEDDQDLWDMPQVIIERLKEERALDESQNQMDEASYERLRAEEFRRVQSNQEQDQHLEKKYIRYFKIISDRGSVRLLCHDDCPEGLVEFHPEDVRKVQLDLSDKERARTGTFQRDIAQNRPDLEFFSVGNDFFDSLCRSLSTDVTGRTYAVECTGDRPPWRGFEFSYSVKPSTELTRKKLVYQSLINHLFAERTEHCFIDERSKISDAPGEFLKIRRSFSTNNKVKVWKNLTKRTATYLTSYYLNWDQLIRSTEKIARLYIRERYDKILTPKIELQFENIDSKIMKLKTATPDGWEYQVVALNQLKNDLTNWELELDSIGFLSINGGILNG